jgi:hypothetical protein
VCDEWRNSFTAFLKDMGERPHRATIDRLNNNKGYSKDNCRWASPKEQVLNRSTTKFLTYQGEKLCKADWARKLGIAPNALNERLKKWPLSKALTQARGITGPKKHERR